MYYYPYNNLIIDWGTSGQLPTPVGTYLSWILGTPNGFGGAIFEWSGTGVYSGWGTIGQATGSSTKLTFTYTGYSSTAGTVDNFSDGTISVTSFSLNSQNPIVQACIDILKQTKGAAKPYKLYVIKNGKTLFTVRSVLWGSQFNLGTIPNYQLVDRQFQGSNQPPL